MEQGSLLSAVKLLEENGFRVTRAYEENNKDAGNVDNHQHMTTGAICLRVVPKKKRDADER